MRRLKGGIPRAFASHKSPDGYAYRRYVTAMLERLGELPADAQVTLREAGRLVVELQAIGREIELVRAARRRRDVNRLRRQMVPMRTQLVKLEERLELLAKAGRRGNPLARLRAVMAGEEQPG